MTLPGLLVATVLAGCAALAAAYKSRVEQDAVLRVDAEVCAAGEGLQGTR